MSSTHTTTANLNNNIPLDRDIAVPGSALTNHKSTRDPAMYPLRVFTTSSAMVHCRQQQPSTEESAAPKEDSAGGNGKEKNNTTNDKDHDNDERFGILTTRGSLFLFPTLRETLPEEVIDEMASVVINRVMEIADERDANRAARRGAKTQPPSPREMTLVDDDVTQKGTIDTRENSDTAAAAVTAQKKQKEAEEEAVDDDEDTDVDHNHPDDLEKVHTKKMDLRHERMVRILSLGDRANAYGDALVDALATKYDLSHRSTLSRPTVTGSQNSGGRSPPPAYQVFYSERLVHYYPQAHEKSRLLPPSDQGSAKNKTEEEDDVTHHNNVVISRANTLNPLACFLHEMPLHSKEICIKLQRATRRRPHRVPYPDELRRARTQPGVPCEPLHHTDNEPDETRRDVSVSDLDSAASDSNLRGFFNRSEAFWVNCYPSLHLRSIDAERQKQGFKRLFPSVRIWVPRNNSYSSGAFEKQLKKDLGLIHLDPDDIKVKLTFDGTQHPDSKLFGLQKHARRRFYDISDEGLAKRREGKPEPYHRALAVALAMTAAPTPAESCLLLHENEEEEEEGKPSSLTKVLPPLAECCHGLIHRTVDIAIGVRYCYESGNIRGLGICRFPVNARPTALLHAFRSVTINKTIPSEPDMILSPSTLYYADSKNDPDQTDSNPDAEYDWGKRQVDIWQNAASSFDMGTSFVDLDLSADYKINSNDDEDEKCVKKKRIDDLRSFLQRRQKHNNNERTVQDYLLPASSNYETRYLTRGSKTVEQKPVLDEEDGLPLVHADFKPQIAHWYNTKPTEEYLAACDFANKKKKMKRMRKKRGDTTNSAQAAAAKSDEPTDDDDGDQEEEGAGEDDSNGKAVEPLLEVMAELPHRSLGYVNSARHRYNPWIPRRTKSGGEGGDGKKKTVEKNVEAGRRIMKSSLVVLATGGNEDGYATFDDFSELDEDDLLA